MILYIDSNEMIYNKNICYIKLYNYLKAEGDI